MLASSSAIRPVDIDKLVFSEKEMELLKDSKEINEEAYQSIPEEYRNTDFVELRRALRAADARFFQDPWPNYDPDWDLVKKPVKQELDVENAEKLIKARQVQEELERASARQLRDFVANLSIYEVHSGVTCKQQRLGKLLSFRTLLVGGNEDGYGGFGMGKGASPEQATERAVLDLRKNMIFVPRIHSRTIIQEVTGKFNRTTVWMQPQTKARGMRAGMVVETVMEVLGIRDLTTKVRGNRNPYSQVFATFDGLLQQSAPRSLALAMGVNYYTGFQHVLGQQQGPSRQEMQRQSQAVQKIIDSVADMNRRRQHNIAKVDMPDNAEMFRRELFMPAFRSHKPIPQPE